jgi:hypothetical protein
MNTKSFILIRDFARDRYKAIRSFLAHLFVQGCGFDTEGILWMLYVFISKYVADLRAGTAFKAETKIIMRRFIIKLRRKNLS